MKTEKTYLVINEGTSAVAISTRHESILIAAGENYPLTMDEIRQVNSGSVAFKAGLLFFEKEYEREIYDDLRIRDWKKILHNDQIVEILQNPTTEGIQTLIDIDIPAYFDRVRGLCTLLKNVGMDLPTKVDKMVTARWKELNSGRIRSGLLVKQKGMGPDTVPVSEFEKYKAEMEAKLTSLMKAMSDKGQVDNNDKSAEVESVQEIKPESTVTEAEQEHATTPKPRAPRRSANQK